MRLQGIRLQVNQREFSAKIVEVFERNANSIDAQTWIGKMDILYKTPFWLTGNFLQFTKQIYLKSAWFLSLQQAKVVRALRQTISI